MTPAPNVAQAREFLARLDPEAARFTFQTFDDTPAKRKDLARVVCADPTNGFFDHLASANGLGAGVFVTPAETDGKGRQAHNITRVRAVFVDLDGAPLAPVLEAGLEPHIVVESSPGRWHAYWLVDDCPLDQFGKVQRALARRFDGDPSVHDLPRVMRVPGFLHRKREPFLSHTLDDVGFNGPPYPLATIVDALGLDLEATGEIPHNGERGDSRTADGKIAPGSRHRHLFALGRSMAKRGCSPEAVRAALFAENAERCDPPLPDQDVRELAERAFTAKDARDWRDDPRGEAENQRPEDQPADAPLWTLPDPIGEHEFEAASIAPLCIVENYLFADVAVLVAPGGTGKTTLTLYEAIHVVLGRDLYGLRVHKPGPVLILTAEDSREMLVARVRALAGALGLTPDEQATLRRDLRISDVSGEALKLTLIIGDVVMPSPTVDDIIDQVRTLAPVLVNIDPAVSFGVGETRVNDAEQGLIEAARRIRRELGCCCRYVHHSGKQNARDGSIDQYAGRGGSALPDGARMVAVLQPLKPDAWMSHTGFGLLDGESGMVLARPKLSYAPPQPDILISRKGYTFSHTSRFEQSKAEALAAACDQIVRFLESELAQDRQHTQNTLTAQAGVLNMARDTVRDVVHTLLARGRIEVVAEKKARGARTYLRPVAVRETE